MGQIGSKVGGVLRRISDRAVWRRIVVCDWWHRSVDSFKILDAKRVACSRQVRAHQMSPQAKAHFHLAGFTLSNILSSTASCLENPLTVTQYVVTSNLLPMLVNMNPTFDGPNSLLYAS